MAGEELDVPVIGPTDKRWVIGGAAVVAVLVAYAWWKHQQDQAAAAAAPVVDPSTGSQTGSDAYVNPNPVVDQPPGTTDAILTDQQWTQAVLSDLENVGYDPGFITDTIGKYLASQPLTADEIKLIRDAWAYEGHPPEHPNLDVRQGGSGTTGVPPAPTGLAQGDQSATGALLYWNASPGATSYNLYHADGSAMNRGLTGTSFWINGMKHGGNYAYQLTAVNSAGESAKSAVVHLSPK